MFIVKKIIRRRACSRHAFSLIEMLMALLVASLLMAALAPVITRRMHDSMTVSVEGEIPGKTTKTHEITYEDCLANGGTEKEEKDLITGKVISRYCEGEFTIPYGYNGNMKVTAIGAGGGGGVSSTAGYIEYTTEGSTNTFTVPNLINNIEATLISGGAGGGAGGQEEKTQTFDTPGVANWNNVPNVIKGKYVNVMGCGGGGGGGGASGMFADNLYKAAGGGGSGGYLKTPVAMYIDPLTASIPYQVGGGGGGAGSGLGYNKTNPPSAGACGGGGDGGSDDGILASNSCNPRYGGGSGTQAEPLETSGLVAAGGGKPSGGNGVAQFISTVPASAITSAGGAGVEGGDGGASGATLTTAPPFGFGGGGGGGKYGGGGGGCSCSSPGGGGGGPTYFNNVLIGSGGGGGGGGGQNAHIYCPGGGGGGGGGSKGGNGGKGATNGGGGRGGGGGYPNGVNGSIGWNSWDTVDGSTIYGWGHCFGGLGGGLIYLNNTEKGTNGASGIIKVTYLDRGPGGSGGGAAAVVPIRHIEAVPNESLSIAIGKGSAGGNFGKINSDASITKPTSGVNTNDTVSSLKRGSNSLLTTLFPPVGGYYTGEVLGNNISPYHAARGHMTDGLQSYTLLYTSGFVSTNGNTAGNGTYIGTATYPNGSTGGAGGTLTTPWFTCTPGSGGTLSNPAGGNAQGYGCGGGGGYGLHDGGKGSGGYARISWNKYWDTALNNNNGAYKYADIGTAGGGASGNIVVYTIPNLKSGDKIKIRIGKGGDGASVNNNTMTDAIKGGDTVFGYNKSFQIIAGGGNPGTNPSITGNHPDTTISNGTGGDINNTSKAYSYNNKNLTTLCNNTTTTNNCYIKGIKGYDGASTKGGNGANLANNPKVLGKSNTGNTGGTGGTTGSNAKGTNAYDKGIGSGGGGAGILDIGINPSITTYNPNTGGSGSNGKIILEWWE